MLLQMQALYVKSKWWYDCVCARFVAGVSDVTMFRAELQQWVNGFSGIWCGRVQRSRTLLQPRVSDEGAIGVEEQLMDPVSVHVDNALRAKNTQIRQFRIWANPCRFSLLCHPDPVGVTGCLVSCAIWKIWVSLLQSMLFCLVTSNQDNAVLFLCASVHSWSLNRCF